MYLPLPTAISFKFKMNNEDSFNSLEISEFIIQHNAFETNRVS